mmetsp:Transcript_110051/g.318141  ORF Transcript_110051/g.318141 Transcript_110051/m.318141 type:complete len:219 (-) Transcript_110051:268-924(-)
MYVLWHLLDQHFEKLVVDNLTSILEIDRDQSLVVAIILVTILVRNSTTVSRVVNENCITSLAILSDTDQCIHDVFSSRLVMAAVVHQDEHVLLQESFLTNEVVLDIFHIVVAATELALLPCIVYTDQNCPLGTIAFTSCRRDDVKLVVNIQHLTATQLRDLAESFLPQNFSHTSQKFNPTHWLPSVVIQYFQQSRSTCTSSLSRWVGQFELSDIVDVG